MKKLTIALNCLSIASTLILYQIYTVIEPMAIAILMLLSLLAILGFANKGLSLVLLILSVCLTCGSVVLLGVMIFGDILNNYPLSLLTSISLVIAYLVVIILNILALKTPAGIKKAE